MNHAHLTEQIIGAAPKVLFSLKPGLDQKLSERALKIEISKQELRCESPRRFDPRYDNQVIGSLVPDPIVEGLGRVNPKVVPASTETHLAQMLGDLNITGLKTALLLNFKNASLAIKRVSD